MTDRSDNSNIAFQGAIGAYSHLACQQAYPAMRPLHCETFDTAFEAVQSEKAALAMIPIENSLAGRVADIHHLMPHSNLHIVAEHFQRVVHNLLAPKGATVDGLTTVHSHIHALSQCRELINELGLKTVVHADTAGAAADIAKHGDTSQAAIASALAAQSYGLDTLRAGIEDAEHNTTKICGPGSGADRTRPGGRSDNYDICVSCAKCPCRSLQSARRICYKMASIC